MLQSMGLQESDTTERLKIYMGASLVAQAGKNLPAMQETPGLIPGSGRSPGEWNDNPLQ